MLYFFSPGKKIHNVMGRIAIDQSIGSPIVICLVFLSNSLLNFASFTSGIQRVLEHGFTTWTKGLCYWPFVHLLTFGVVPAVHQVSTALDTRLPPPTLILPCLAAALWSRHEPVLEFRVVLLRKQEEAVVAREM